MPNLPTGGAINSQHELHRKEKSCLVVVVHDGSVGPKNDRLGFSGGEMLLPVFISHYDLNTFGLRCLILLRHPVVNVTKLIFFVANACLGITRECLPCPVAKYLRQRPEQGKLKGEASLYF
jgi:hypothetical protein